MEMNAMKPLEILKHPHLTEKAMHSVESKNELVFIVDRNASKKDIAGAVEAEYKVKVARVSVSRDLKGRKKAFVRLSEKDSALDIATRLGMM